MKPWFIWNDKNSDAMGLWISKLPRTTRANERYEQVTIPGRAGSLTLLEGEDVYDGYVKEIIVQTVNTNPLLQTILDWLRGSGKLVLSTEDSKVYNGRIAAAVEFERVGNSLLQAKIPIFVEPFKRRRHEADDQLVITDVSATIYNPGDVASKPLVTITTGGETAQTVSVTISGRMMVFTDVLGTIQVDCEAEIVTQNGEIWTGSYTGNSFWKIPVGACPIARTGSGGSVTIDPRWRWV